jgi:hypothetical protein
MNKEIYVTEDYSLFKRLQGNRDVDIKRIQKIKKSINEVGYITSPILVNENYEIVDGQGRFEALKDLGMPIEYIVQPGIGIKECVSMNVYQTNWTQYDYIKTFAEKGYTSYIYFQTLMIKFPLITSLDVFIVALFKKERLYIDEIASGGLVITEEMYHNAYERLSNVYPLIIKSPKTRRILTLIKGIVYCSWLSGIDMDKLIEKAGEVIELNQIPPMSTMSQIMQFMEEIYNRNTKASNKSYIYTEYRKKLSENSYKNLKKKEKKNADRNKLSQQEEDDL